MLMLDLVDGSCFRPGDAIEGVVTWVCRGAPVGGAIKLRWTTRGKGSDDHELVVNLHDKIGFILPFFFIYKSVHIFYR